MLVKKNFDNYQDARYVRENYGTKYLTQNVGYRLTNLRFLKS